MAKGANDGTHVIFCSRCTGLGGFARLMEGHVDVAANPLRGLTWQVAFVKALGETCPWIFLQTSLLMINFTGTDFVIVSISLLVSLKQLKVFYDAGIGFFL